MLNSNRQVRVSMKSCQYLKVLCLKVSVLCTTCKIFTYSVGTLFCIEHCMLLSFKNQALSTPLIVTLFKSSGVITSSALHSSASWTWLLLAEKPAFFNPS